MPRVRLRLLVTIVVVCLSSALAVHFAKAQHSGIDTYAITNARVLPVSGATIEHGTVVVRNGLIAAVGANVTPPSDARIIRQVPLTSRHTELNDAFKKR